MASSNMQVPRFIFQIDEIHERRDAPESVDHEGRWVPIAIAGWNMRRSNRHGVTGRWWYIDGINIQPWSGLPTDASLYKQFSVYYSGGAGLYVLCGDATNPGEQHWSSIMFNHNNETFSSIVAQTGTEPTLRCHDPNARWPRMLLPDIYYGPPSEPYPGRGGFTGELPTFLALVALSMRASLLPRILPQMFQNGQWVIHNEAPGREHKRGVIVSVYALGNNQSQLESYEEGAYGKFYNG